jgi:uncharacterized metal-binding protein YceD (DUF177 family)
MADVSPEFSRPIPLTRLGRAALHQHVIADAEERTSLARRFDLLALDRLEAEVVLTRDGGDVVLTANLEADLAQACSVTLLPVESRITDRFVLRFRGGIDDDEADRLTLETPEDEVIEPLMGDAIDIGEAVAQQLAIAMDPYPRAVGAELPAGDGDADAAFEAAEERPNPFESLASLKKPG